jgi:hypothetical protein
VGQLALTATAGRNPSRRIRRLTACSPSRGRHQSRSPCQTLPRATSIHPPRVRLRIPASTGAPETCWASHSLFGAPRRRLQLLLPARAAAGTTMATRPRTDSRRNGRRVPAARRRTRSPYAACASCLSGLVPTHVSERSRGFRRQSPQERRWTPPGAGPVSHRWQPRRRRIPTPASDGPLWGEPPRPEAAGSGRIGGEASGRISPRVGGEASGRISPRVGGEASGRISPRVGGEASGRISPPVAEKLPGAGLAVARGRASRRAASRAGCPRGQAFPRRSRVACDTDSP